MMNDDEKEVLYSVIESPPEALVSLFSRSDEMKYFKTLATGDSDCRLFLVVETVLDAVCSELRFNIFCKTFLELGGTTLVLVK